MEHPVLLYMLKWVELDRVRCQKLGKMTAFCEAFRISEDPYLNEQRLRRDREVKKQESTVQLGF